MNKKNKICHLVKTSLQVCVLGLITGLTACAQEAENQPDVSDFFDKTHGALESALDLYDEQQELPSRDDLRFYDYLSTTKEHQQQKVDAYLDVAADALGISGINERRGRIASQREKIADLRSRISSYERAKISAPKSSYNPLTTTKSKYEKKIESAKNEISAAEQQIADEKQKLVNDLKKIGMPISDENVDVLLESITGDQFVRISIMFDNAKNYARELERLTEQTGEDLETAKKYYGVYLMLLHTIDRLQLKFVATVDEEYYPQLEKYVEQAKENIKDARTAIKQGGDRTILENNIYSNEITLDAASYYKQSLSKQKMEMKRANNTIKRNILTATNTYKTAALSKDIASLISVSRRAFDSISGLSVPDLRPFENAKLKAEFSRLSREIQGNK